MKMTHTLRRMTLLVALLMLLPTAAGCASQTQTADDTTQPAAETTAVETTAAETEPALTDTVPADLRFPGETVTFFVRSGLKSELVAEAVTGEVVNDAVLARNRTVEERLGVTLNFVDNGSGYSDYNAEIRRSVQGQTGEYDVVTTYAYYGAALAVEGLYMNLQELPYLTLTQPWWNQSFVEEMTVYDSLYFIVGDMTTTAFDRTMVTFFNKELVESHYRDLDLYAVVNEGKWTLDYLGELVKDSYQDLNGNMQNDLEDFHGVGFNLGSMCVDGMQTALGIELTTRDNEGNLELTLNTQHYLDAYEKLYNFIYRNSGVGYNPTTTTGYYGTMGNTYYASQKLFNRQCIFAFDILSDSNILRDFDDPYGILPLPKYDEAQSEYRTTPQDAYSLVSVTTTVSSPELVGAVLEVMGSESYRQVRPAYFEKTYKYKYLDAPDDAEMFDLVIDSISYDFGVVNSNALSDPGQTFRKYMVQGTESVSSVLAATEKMHKKKLTAVLEKYQELGQQ